MTKNYCQIAAKYCQDVVNGKIDACLYVKQACQRQINDLKRKDKDWGYEFNETLANRVCVFIECLKHIEGPLAGTFIQLQPWQCFILTTVFGWVRKGTYYRRYRTAYVEVPRGNGKSTLLSGVGLYMLCADNEAGAQVYSAATKKDQAKIVFKAAHLMAERNPDLINYYHLDVREHSIIGDRGAAVFEPISSDAKSQDGFNVHCAIIDELHAHKSRDLYDVIETGARKRPQSLIFAITTAGTNLAGICMERHNLTVSILGGETEIESVFGIIYTLDENDAWDNLNALKKANPNWGISVDPVSMTEALKTAKFTKSNENNFKTKHLDIWVNADTSWCELKDYDACVNKKLKPSMFKGEQCTTGLDLATKLDIAAKVRLHWREDENGIVHYFVFEDYYLPEDTVTNSPTAQYSGWVKNKYLHATKGTVTDQKQIIKALKKDENTFDVWAVGYDPYQSGGVVSIMEDYGSNMVEYRNTVAKMSEPMKYLQALMKERRIHFTGNPVTRWMFSNVVAHEDEKQNIFPKKPKDQPTRKIDGVVALIMALGCALAEGSEILEDNGEDYEEDEEC